MKIFWNNHLSYNVALIVTDEKMVAVHMSGNIRDLHPENPKESSLWIKTLRNDLKPCPKGSLMYNEVLKRYLETLEMVTIRGNE